MPAFLAQNVVLLIKVLTDDELTQGDILLVRPHGRPWSDTERETYLIIQMYLTPEEARALVSPKLVDTGKVDERGRPIMKKVKKRAHKINLKALGFSRRRDKEKVMKAIKKNVANKTMSHTIIEEK